MESRSRSEMWLGVVAGGVSISRGVEKRVYLSRGKEMRLLLVEPHRLLARALTMGMGEEGFEVEVVGDRERADERLLESSYDVILLDLPAGNSLNTFRRWRRAGLRTPVLVFTTSESEVDRRAVGCAESLDIAVKPFVFEELLVRVRRLVQEGAPQEMTACRQGPISHGLNRK